MRYIMLVGVTILYSRRSLRQSLVFAPEILAGVEGPIRHCTPSRLVATSSWAESAFAVLWRGGPGRRAGKIFRMAITWNSGVVHVEVHGNDFLNGVAQRMKSSLENGLEAALHRGP